VVLAQPLPERAKAFDLPASRSTTSDLRACGQQQIMMNIVDSCKQQNLKAVYNISTQVVVMQ